MQNMSDWLLPAPSPAQELLTKRRGGRWLDLKLARCRSDCQSDLHRTTRYAGLSRQFPM